MISLTLSTVLLTRLPTAFPAATAIRSAALIAPSAAPAARRPTSAPISPAAWTDPRIAVTATDPTSTPTFRTPESAVAAVLVTRSTTPVATAAAPFGAGMGLGWTAFLTFDALRTFAMEFLPAGGRFARVDAERNGIVTCSQGILSTE